MEGSRKVPLVHRKNVKNDRDKHRDFYEKAQAGGGENGKKGRKRIKAETGGGDEKGTEEKSERRTAGIESDEKERDAYTANMVQVTALDLSTVGAGKPRGVKDACKDKIKVESMCKVFRRTSRTVGDTRSRVFRRCWC